MYQSQPEWYYCIIPMLSSVHKWLNTHPYYTAVLLGLLYGMGFLTPWLLWCGYIAVVGVWYLLATVPRRDLVGILPVVFGVKALVALSWFWATFPIDWLPGLAYNTQVVAVFLYWLSSAVWLSSAGLFIVFLWHWHKKIPPLLLPLYYGVVIVLSEYLAAVVFSVLTIGDGAYISGAFSFGHTSYLFPWLYSTAVFGGVYAVGVVGVTFLVAMWQLRRSYSRGNAVLPAAVCLLIIYSFVSLPETSFSHTIAFIQTDFNARQQSDIIDTKLAAIEEMVDVALREKSDYILLPEDTRYLTERYYAGEVGSAAASNAWRVIKGETGAVLVDSGRTVDERTGRVVQRAYVWGDTGSVLTADKKYLVPQGEYMPSLYAFFLHFLGLGPVADYLSEIINYTSSDRMISADAATTIPSVLFCFESVDPLAAKRLIAHRPSEFIVHPMSHSWFHEPVVVWRQLETMLRFQSVYAGVPIMSVGNEIRGQIYWPDGSIEKPSTLVTMPYGTVDVWRPATTKSENN